MKKRGEGVREGGKLCEKHSTLAPDSRAMQQSAAWLTHSGILQRGQPDGELVDIEPIPSPQVGITFGICTTVTLKLGDQCIAICPGLAWILH